MGTVLNSRLSASVIGTLLPVTVAYIAYTALSIFNPWMMASIAQILISYLHTVLVIFVCASFSSVFVVSAGSMFDLGLSFIGANVALLIMALIIDLILEEMLVGYVTNTSGIIVTTSTIPIITDTVLRIQPKRSNPLNPRRKEVGLDA